MKKTFLFSLTLVSLLFGCMDMNSTQPEQNFNFPAAYIINGGSSTMSVINLNTNEIAGLVQLTDGSSMPGHSMASGSFLIFPHHIYLNPDKTQIAIAAPGMDLSAGHAATTAPHSGMAKVAILDAVKGQTIKLIDVPMMNHNAVYSPDGKEIWTSQMDTKGTVLVYDATTYSLKNTVNVGNTPTEITFSADGSTAFVANGADNSVTAISPSTKKVLATIPVGKNPVGAWVGKDNRMYVDNEDGQSVSIIDVKTLKVIEIISLGFMPGYVAYLPNMKEMWVSDPMAGKVHYWTKGADEKFTKTGSFATAAGAHAIGLNGTTAYVTNQEAASVSVVDVVKHTKIKDLTVGLKPNGIVIKL